jgi:hypothetical protein
MIYTGQDHFTHSRGSDRPLHLKLAYVTQTSLRRTYLNTEVEGNMFLRNVGTRPQKWTALQSRRPQSEYYKMWHKILYWAGYLWVS